MRLRIQIGFDYSIKRGMRLSLTSASAYSAVPARQNRQNGAPSVKRAARQGKPDRIFMRPGPPTGERLYRKFERSYDAEFLNEELFDTMVEARVLTQR